MFRLCALVHILILHVLLFQNPIYRFPYYSLVYNVGFYLRKYKSVSSSSQSSSKLHHTSSHLIVIPSYSPRTIIKVLVLVVSHQNINVPCHSLSFLVISCHCHISMFSRGRLRSMGDPALYPHSAVHCVSVYRWFSHLCTCRHISGTEFVSHFFRSLGKALNMKLYFTSGYHPEGDGQTKCTNQTLEQYICWYCNY